MVRLSAVLAVVAWAKGCGDGDNPTAPPAPEPEPDRPATVTISPTAVELTALGAAVQLRAEVRDQNSGVMANVTVTWSSGDPSVATVEASGLVTAAGNGQATITASAGAVSGAALVTVTQSVVSVEVSPAEGMIHVGDTLRLTAEAFDANGHAVTDAEFLWESGDTSVAMVEASGLVTAVAQGAATITARAGAAAGRAEITVGPNPDRVALEAFYHATGGPNWVNSENWLTDAPLGEWHGVTTDASGGVVSLVLAIEWDAASRSWRNPGLQGQIPPELANLARLEALNLRGSGVSGTIPSGLEGLTRLKVLDLAWNPELSGAIPPELGNLASLEQLHLGDNLGMSGPLPPEIGRLANLVTLSLHDIPLRGSIPPQFGGLARLEYLDLSETGLRGSLPPELLRLGRLRSFDLRYTAGLCIPGTSAFVGWTAITGVSGPWCNEADVAALERLYETAGGDGWTNAEGWTEGRALESWYGVTADSEGRVLELDLANNGLEGRLTASLGNLARTTALRIGGNPLLSGHLPVSLTRMPLRELGYVGTGLCVPQDESLHAWLNAIPAHRGTGARCTPLSDRDVLEALYELTGGPGWTQKDNWLTDAPLDDWHGVGVDRGGRVTHLYLRYNNLTGPIPPELGNLSRLSELVLEGNSLSGPIPPELGRLDELATLAVDGNSLSGPIPPELGNLTRLAGLELGGNELSGPVPPELGNLANLWRLDVAENRLSGPIPPELGRLANLWWLNLAFNQLSGPIPPELGRLVGLSRLYLWSNELSGPIPPELGRLRSLQALNLSENELSGPIPPELGNLASLENLQLVDNHLSGSLPPALGRLANLVDMGLDNNRLTGSVPASFRGLASLTRLTLNNNIGMSGPIPVSLAGLRRLSFLAAGGTDLCVPADPALLDWLEGVANRRIAPCDRGGASAYLVQAVQSREFPVPLVGGEEALLRVFLTAGRSNGDHLPRVRARFYLNGAETHVADIPGKPGPIPTEVEEGLLSMSVNAEIPGSVIQPGLEMVIEIDPEAMLDPGLGVAKRIPERGRLAVDVRAMPRLDLTLVPFIWSETPDRSVAELIEAVAADPENHPLLAETRTLLPVGDLIVRAHQPVVSSSNNAFDLLRETEVIRTMEGGRGHYLGTIANGSGPLGVADQGGRSSYASPSGWVMAHELGHNFDLNHAPCGTFGDPAYPYADGSIGAWGYGFRHGGLVSRGWRDLMSYCNPRWISDYSFANALRFRLIDEVANSGGASAPGTSLLLWGGVAGDGAPFLEPTFVVDAPPTLPRAGGDYRLTGRTVTGAELFSLDFAMRGVADDDGGSSFAFVLPAREAWAGTLASITLAGPDRSHTLDGDADLPMTIMRDAGTGEVSGILRGPPQADAAALAPEARDDSLDMLFSRGIPGAAAWAR